MAERLGDASAEFSKAIAPMSETEFRRASLRPAIRWGGIIAISFKGLLLAMMSNDKCSEYFRVMLVGRMVLTALGMFAIQCFQLPMIIVDAIVVTYMVAYTATISVSHFRLEVLFSVDCGVVELGGEAQTVIGLVTVIYGMSLFVRVRTPAVVVGAVLCPSVYFLELALLGSHESIDSLVITFGHFATICLFTVLSARRGNRELHSRWREMREAAQIIGRQQSQIHEKEGLVTAMENTLSVLCDAVFQVDAELRVSSSSDRLRELLGRDMTGVNLSDVLVSDQDRSDLKTLAAQASEINLPQMRPLDFKLNHDNDSADEAVDAKCVRLDVFIVDAQVGAQKLYLVGVRSQQTTEVWAPDPAGGASFDEGLFDAAKLSMELRRRPASSATFSSVCEEGPTSFRQILELDVDDFFYGDGPFVLDSDECIIVTCGQHLLQRGLMPGDRITRVNESKVRTSEDFRRGIVETKRAGGASWMSLTVHRPKYEFLQQPQLPPSQCSTKNTSLPCTMSGTSQDDNRSGITGITGRNSGVTWHSMQSHNTANRAGLPDKAFAQEKLQDFRVLLLEALEDLAPEEHVPALEDAALQDAVATVSEAMPGEKQWVAM